MRDTQKTIPRNQEIPEADQVVSRERLPRRALLSRATALAVLGSFVLLLLIVAAIVWYGTGMLVTVPDITGIQEGVARTRLGQNGLTVASVERRFDAQPAGTVLLQDPASGVRVRRGSGVALVVSAGTEEFSMPDVIGLGIVVARAQLEQRGLVVHIEAVESDAAPDTVLETIPAPGATVRTSDVVRVRIASEESVPSVLLPFPLHDEVFVIDPSPVPSGEVDAPLEATRRLRSLLEAAGARVVVTRSVTDTDVAPAARAQRAAETTPSITAVIGIDATDSAPGGLAVLVPEQEGVAGDRFAVSSLLADEIIDVLGQPDSPVQRVVLPPDPVANAVSSPLVRVRLGSFAVREDTAAFRDPTWSDSVAQAIYRALGRQFSGS